MKEPRPEIDAKQLWCRHAFVLENSLNGKAVAVNRPKMHHCNCIGSQCMDWVWDCTPSKAAYWNKEHPDSDETCIARGHCGVGE